MPTLLDHIVIDLANRQGLLTCIEEFFTDKDEDFFVELNDNSLRGTLTGGANFEMPPFDEEKDFGAYAEDLAKDGVLVYSIAIDGSHNSEDRRPYTAIPTYLLRRVVEALASTKQ